MTLYLLGRRVKPESPNVTWKEEGQKVSLKWPFNIMSVICLRLFEIEYVLLSNLLLSDATTNVTFKTNESAI